MDWIQLARDNVTFRNSIGTVMNHWGFTEGEKTFLDEQWLSASQEEFCSVKLAIYLIGLP
jgi:hypothetical protein